MVLFFPLGWGEMPALLCRLHCRAHSVKSLAHNVLGLVGIAPVHETLIGMVEGMDDATRRQWFAKLRALGGKAA